MRCRYYLFVLWVFATCNIFSQELPLSPLESMRNMSLPPGYTVSLFASEPQIKKVTDWAWDHKGRLWVTESVDYPKNVKPSPIVGGNDKIKILEDTNGDGRADKVTVFADNLNIPVGIAFTERGVVAVLYGAYYLIEDTNGDDVADKKTFLFNAYQKGDTHTQDNSVRYGLDNAMWASYGGFPIPNVKGGIFRFGLENPPSHSHFYKFDGGITNIWGIGFNEEGDVFNTRPGGTSHSINSTGGAFRLRQNVIPFEYYNKIPQSYRGEARIANHQAITVARGIEIWNAGLRTSGTTNLMSTNMSAEVYTARLFGTEYHNKAIFVCDPGSRVVHQEFLVPHKSRFYTKRGSTDNLITSSDPWFAPIRAAAGPDGAVWVMDWYNTNIGHHETRPGYPANQGGASYWASGMPRDKDRGRIYRIIPITPRETDPTLTLDKDNIPQLANALRHDNRFWRLTAQRLLVYKKSKKQEVVQAVLPILEYQNRNGETENTGAIHALWTLKGLGAIEENLNKIYPLLRHPSGAVVMNVLQVLPKTQATVNEIRDARVLEDTNPHVRLKALLALSNFSNVSGTLLMRSADKNLDEYVQDALAMASTQVTIGNAGNGGNRISNLVLQEANPPGFSNVTSKNLVNHLSPVLYVDSRDVTGEMFDVGQQGVVSFYSLSGKLLGTRTLDKQKFTEGTLTLSSRISFYRLQTSLNQVYGKVVRMD